MTDDNHKLLLAMAREIKTQDNAHTQDPVFCVQQHKRVYGFDSAYSDNSVFIDHESNEVTDFSDLQCPECSKQIDVKDLDDEQCATCLASLDLGNWCLTRTAYKDTWETVQSFFTRAGAEEYLRINGHNLQSEEPPRIWVESAFRNSEWQAIRTMLMQMAVPSDETQPPFEVKDGVVHVSNDALRNYTGDLVRDARAIAAGLDKTWFEKPKANHDD